MVLKKIEGRQHPRPVYTQITDGSPLAILSPFEVRNEIWCMQVLQELTGRLPRAALRTPLPAPPQQQQHPRSSSNLPFTRYPGRNSKAAHRRCSVGRSLERDGKEHWTE